MVVFQLVEQQAFTHYSQMGRENAGHRDTAEQQPRAQSPGPGWMALPPSAPALTPLAEKELGGEEKAARSLAPSYLGSQLRAK